MPHPTMVRGPRYIVGCLTMLNTTKPWTVFHANHV